MLHFQKPQILNKIILAFNSIFPGSHDECLMARVIGTVTSQSLRSHHINYQARAY